MFNRHLPLSVYKKYQKNSESLFWGFVLFIFVLELLLFFAVKPLLMLASKDLTLAISVLLFSLFLIALIKAAISLFDRKIDENDGTYGVGFEAEELAAAKLSSLGSDYFPIVDLQKGAGIGNIDHIVVGPTGIFVVETKYSKKWLVDIKRGKKSFTSYADKFSRQAAQNALWLHNLIKDNLGIDEWVNAVVVRPYNKDFKIQNDSSNKVWFLDGNTVVDHIKNNNGRLSKNEAESVYQFLCDFKRKNKSSK